MSDPVERGIEARFNSAKKPEDTQTLLSLPCPCATQRVSLGLSLALSLALSPSLGLSLHLTGGTLEPQVDMTSRQGGLHRRQAAVAGGGLEGVKEEGVAGVRSDPALRPLARHGYGFKYCLSFRCVRRIHPDQFESRLFCFNRARGSRANRRFSGFVHPWRRAENLSSTATTSPSGNNNGGTATHEREPR